MLQDGKIRKLSNDSVVDWRLLSPLFKQRQLCKFQYDETLEDSSRRKVANHRVTSSWKID